MPKPKPLWVVEKILDKRINKDNPEYLVKWKNYPVTDNSWEPRSSFRGTNFIDKFEAQISNKCKKVELGKTEPKERPKLRSRQTTHKKSAVGGPAVKIVVGNQAKRLNRVTKGFKPKHLFRGFLGKRRTPPPPPRDNSAPVTGTTQDFSGLTLERIDSVRKVGSQVLDLEFLVKFNEKRVPEFVPRSVLSDLFPRDVLRYYEENLTYNE